MAKTDLDTLVVRVEADLKQFDAGMDKATKRVQVFDKTAGAASGGVTKFTGTTQRMQTQVKKTAGGMGELRESFASLVSQMAGVHPIAGKLLSVFGSLAVGSGVMIGVLGGIAAVGAAFRFLTRDITAAKEAAEKSFAILDKLAEEARSMGGIAEQNRAIVEAEERLKKIRPLLAALRAQRELGDETDPSSAERSLAAEHDELAFKVGLATARIKELTAEKIKANNDTHEKRVKEEQKAHEDAAAAVRTHNDALAALRDAGLASNTQLAELHNHMSSLASAAADASKGWQAQVDALRELLGLLPKVSSEVKKTRLPLMLPSSGTVLAPNQPVGDPREWVERGADNSKKLAKSTGVLGDAFDELTSRLSSMLPGQVSAAVTNPLSLFGNVGSMIVGGIFDVFSRRSSAARRVRELEQELAMRDIAASAKRAAAELNNFATSMRNVPLIFNTAFAGYRVGASRDTAVPFTRPPVNGGINITGPVNVYPTNFADFERSMRDAADRGNSLARKLVSR